MLFTWSMRTVPRWLGDGAGRPPPAPSSSFPAFAPLVPEPLLLAGQFDGGLLDHLPPLVFVDLRRHVRPVISRSKRDLGSQPARIEILQRLQGSLHPRTVQLPFL